jgi:hypothetical protein
MSVRPSTADVDQGNGLVSFVPTCDIVSYAVKIQKKSERNRKSQIRVLDLPAINFPAQ